MNEKAFHRLKEVGFYSAFVGGALTFVIGGTYALHKEAQIYRGPVDVPGITEVHAEKSYRFCGPSVDCLREDGVRVDITFDDGTTATVRDFDANFRVNDKDTVKGTIPASVNLDEVLDKVRPIPQPVKPAPLPIFL